MRFTAAVKNGRVVVRDVPLADGEVVDITIERQDDVYVLTEEEEREIELGEADAAAGRVRPAHEFLAELRARDTLRGADRGARRARAGSRKDEVGGTRPRSKPASTRARSRK